MTRATGGDDARPHVVVINRWREHYADYHRYLDHSTHRVTYISTEIGLGSVPPTATDIALVDATDDLSQARAALAELVSKYGPPHRIVALKEDDLLVGAQLREEWDVAGHRPADLLRFRDKFLMGQAIAAAGLPIPAFATVTGPESVLDFADVHGWPVVLKPRIGSSSAGVVVLDGPAALASFELTDEPMLVQAFNPHPIHHVDGVFTGTDLACLRVSRYVNTCLGFREGSFLGSVEVDDPLVIGAVRAAATDFLRALTDRPTPLHLEVFFDGETCTFLEVGARAGGSEIPFIWRDLHGYDLMRAAFDLQLGLEPQLPPTTRVVEVGGWLLIPAPAARPCRITEVTSMVGGQPGPYAEALLGVGEILPEADAYYEHVGGRFRFRGRSSAEVAEALEATAKGFRVSAEPVERVGAR
ncbi:acetyl-CoA carboxylase biotin carboxylase subunit family protein [Kutzneria sp. 744]|uniref:ATP-grasp domain-containing protein n=1 Tax=Kutzneria sp. (strain 744) TaxID=345341 RepID=UPI0003EED922|nr:biotin carboxylase [Kutzneria sp. 744]EWM18489.1 biotin carboxylase [Kutzneria sp. 744]